MHTKSDHAPESTKLFVALSLKLLVIFVLLNVAAFPSRKLLQQVIHHEPLPPNVQEVLPDSLKKLAVRTINRSPENPYEFAESSILIDGRQLDVIDPAGRSRKEELFSWLRGIAEGKGYQIDITCFFEAGGGVGFVSALRSRRDECAEIFSHAGTEAPGGILPGSVRFYGRVVPPQLGTILDENSLRTDKAYVVTITDTPSGN